jgi:branched-chain amino acid transport system ATP-binding protein
MVPRKGWPPMLEIKALEAGYGETLILRGIDLNVAEGALVAVLGANGAGKTTLNMTISGVVRPRGGEIRFAGQRLAALSPADIVALGLIHVPEGRKIFPNLNVREVLELGSYRRARANRARNLERVFGIFPRLRERTRQAAGTLSGGEQQMLAIGRALMAKPKVLLLDEPSMGLAPQMIANIFRIITEINKTGVTILLVEQNAQQALQRADRAYILETGNIVKEAKASDLLNDPAVREAYLGTGA